MPRIDLNFALLYISGSENWIQIKFAIRVLLFSLKEFMFGFISFFIYLPVRVSYFFLFLNFRQRACVWTIELFLTRRKALQFDFDMHWTRWLNCESVFAAAGPWEKTKLVVILMDEIAEIRECHPLTGIAGRQIALWLGPGDLGFPWVSCPPLPTQPMVTEGGRYCSTEYCRAVIYPTPGVNVDGTAGKGGVPPAKDTAAHMAT